MKTQIVMKDPLKNAKFAYFSKCCNERARKLPLLATNKDISAVIGASPEAEGTLGSWRCSKCGKPCKCNREVTPVNVTLR
jgi:hypothetical protein